MLTVVLFRLMCFDSRLVCNLCVCFVPKLLVIDSSLMSPLADTFTSSITLLVCLNASFFLFRQLCLYISDSLHLFTLFLTDSLEKCQTKSFENEYSTFCNFQILYHKSTLQIFPKTVERPATKDPQEAGQNSWKDWKCYLTNSLS